MVINFVGLFNQPGYVGEISDETHIARELEKWGNEVRRIPRDEWREYVIEGKPEGKYSGVPKDLKADINLIAKWHHFYDGSFISELKTASEGAPVLYWIWDFMYDQGFPEWHLKMAQEADLLLSGEAGIFHEYIKQGINPYYFQMDVCDGDLHIFKDEPKIHNVIFTGSCIGQGHRKEYLQEINKKIPVKIWAWNWEEWEKLGFEAHPAVYGEEYNRLIGQSKIVLGFSVEPNCWGYWSNRVGKVLRAGGFLLHEYTPGMETMLPYGCVRYFNSPDQAVSAINYYLEHEVHTNNKTGIARRIGEKFTSGYKTKALTILMKRYLEGDPSKWNRLP